MKIPVYPPDISSLFSDIAPNLIDRYMQLFKDIGPTDKKDRYLHWDKLRHLTPPEGVTPELWWAGLKFARHNMFQTTDLTDKDGRTFNYCIPPVLHEKLHKFDLNTAGTLTTDKQITTPHMRNTYLVKSLIEEAISSSQLEGASTTRRDAKSMILEERKPENISEQMILNNYNAMQFIREIKDETLNPEIIFTLHEILTYNTLDDDCKPGTFRKESDNVFVTDQMNQILHTPPPASELRERLDRLCSFANVTNSKDFVHPVIRAIILHFILAYDHPFVDGNGRTARALFYWSMANQGYWLMEFISISREIKKSPAQYSKAFLYTETDDNDLTYFIFHQVDMIQNAIDELFFYLERKKKDVEDAMNSLQKNDFLKKQLNFRQLSLLRHALKHPKAIYTITEHKNIHATSYETARKDLIAMSDKLKLLAKLKNGRDLVFLSPTDLEKRIHSAGKNR